MAATSTADISSNIRRIVLAIESRIPLGLLPSGMLGRSKSSVLM